MRGGDSNASVISCIHHTRYCTSPCFKEPTRERSHDLVGGDVGADEGLVQDGKEAALGLLALFGAGGDEVGVVGGDGRGEGTVSERSWEVLRVEGNVRLAQLRMTRLRTSVAQHWGVPLEQRGAWRSSRVLMAGAAAAAAAKARIMENCILKDEVIGWCLKGEGKVDCSRVVE